MPDTRQLIPLLLMTALASPAALADDAPLPADRPIPEAIDHFIDARLKEKGATPAPRAADTVLARRLHLDLAGRVPTVAEAQAFAASNDPAKLERLVDRLMDSPSFVRQQVDAFDTMLMADSEGRRDSLKEYLTPAIAENRPWDQVFRELIEADPTNPKTKGADAYLKRVVGDLDRLTNEVSVSFFGVNVSCAKCHDHPLVLDWTQEHFFGMKSFFSRTFDNGGFLGEEEFGTVSFQTVGGAQKNARLMFLDGKPIDEPESKEPNDKEKERLKKLREEFKKKKEPLPPPEYSRRAQLLKAAFKPGNDLILARAIVNRIWHRFTGQGLVMPLDQMHSMNPPSHPQLLEWLAHDLIRRKYDLRPLMRGIVLSQAYQRTSRWDPAQGDRPSPKLFAVANIKPLTPRQYAVALRMAGQDPRAHRSDMSDEEFQKWLEGVENGAQGLANRFEQPGDNFQIGVDEALMFSNDEGLQRELTGGGIVRRLLEVKDDRELIDTATWAVLSRPADDEEVKVFSEHLAQRKDRREQAVQQLVWALMASGEMRFNH